MKIFKIKKGKKKLLYQIIWMKFVQFVLITWFNNLLLLRALLIIDSRAKSSQSRGWLQNLHKNNLFVINLLEDLLETKNFQCFKVHTYVTELKCINT